MASDADLVLATNGVVNASQQFWNGGRGVLLGEASVYGTIKLEYQSPNGTWLDTGISLAANGMAGVELPPGKVRANITGTTAAYVYLYGSRYSK